MAQNNRLDFLMRKNAGRMRLPSLRERLALALHIPVSTVEFLPLEESDRIRQRVEGAFPPRNELEHCRGDYPFISKSFRNAQTHHPLLPQREGDVFIILPDAETVGVLRMPLTFLSNNWGALLEASPDGFIAVDDKCSNQAVIDTDEGETSGDVIFHFAAWGTEWSNALREYRRG